MSLSSRFHTRGYSSAPGLTCSTVSCTRATTGLSQRCYRCQHNHKRFGHPLQILPTTRELDKRIRAAEEARGRLKLLDLNALEARWTTLVDDCRARATPSYKDRGTLSYSGWEREASQLIRDCAEQTTFLRVLDLLTAVHLLNLEGYWRSEEAMGCSMVELLRRTSRVDCKVMAMSAANGTISRSYRRELSRNSRLAAARLLNVGLGGAAVALAKLEAAREEKAQAVRSDYWSAVNAITTTSV
jgi:hypothetical protein